MDAIFGGPYKVIKVIISANFPKVGEVGLIMPRGLKSSRLRVCKSWALGLGFCSNTCMYVCIYIYIYIYVCVCVYIHVLIHTLMSCAHMCLYTHYAIHHVRKTVARQRQFASRHYSCVATTSVRSTTATVATRLLGFHTVIGAASPWRQGDGHAGCGGGAAGGGTKS